MVNEDYERLRRAPQEGKLVAWIEAPAAGIMLTAQDILYMNREAYSSGMAARKAEKELMEAAEAEGFLSEGCSYGRIALGCGLFMERGISPDMARPDAVMPKPNFVVGYPGCPAATAFVEEFCRLLKIPALWVSSPYLWHESDIERNETVVVNSLKGLVTALEDMTGRPYNWDRLKELMANLKKAAILQAECMSLCTNVPSPMSFFDWAISLAIHTFRAGLPETVEYYRKLKAELEERVAQKVGVVPNEKHRLLFEGVMYWPKIGALSRKLASLDACAVAGIYTHRTFWTHPERIDPDKPLESIAAYMVRDIAIMQPAEWQVNAVIELCWEYSIDGILANAPRTCWIHNFYLKYLAERVPRELGLPVTIFEADIADDRFYSHAQTSTAIEGLIEVIEARKGEGKETRTKG